MSPVAVSRVGRMVPERCPQPGYPEWRTASQPSDGHVEAAGIDREAEPRLRQQGQAFDAHGVGPGVEHLALDPELDAAYGGDLEEQLRVERDELAIGIGTVGIERRHRVDRKADPELLLTELDVEGRAKLRRNPEELRQLRQLDVGQVGGEPGAP